MLIHDERHGDIYFFQPMMMCWGVGLLLCIWYYIINDVVIIIIIAIVYCVPTVYLLLHIRDLDDCIGSSSILSIVVGRNIV